MAETIDGVGERPNGIAVAAGAIWVIGDTRTTVTRIDIATSRVLEDAPTVGPGAPSIVAAGTSVWVAAKDARRVVELDSRTGRIVRRLRPGGPPTRLAIGFGSLWVGTLGDGTRPPALVRYDFAGNELDRVPLPRGAAALTTGGGYVWVSERRGNAIVRIDPRTLRPQPWSRLVAPASALCYCGGYLWGTVTRADSIARVNPRRAGNPTTSVAGHRPAQVVAAGGHLFVASNTDHTVRVLDPQSAKPVRAPLSVPGNPYAIAAGDGAVWVSGIEGSVSRIDYR